MRIKKNIAVSESGFVFDPGTGDSFSLNEQAREIVRLLSEGKAYDEITGIMTSEYDIDKAGFEKYFFDFLGMLKQYNLLEEDEQEKN